MKITYSFYSSLAYGTIEKYQYLTRRECMQEKQDMECMRMFSSLGQIMPLQRRLTGCCLAKGCKMRWDRLRNGMLPTKRLQNPLGEVQRAPGSV
jgi:hypothetical protein